MEVKIDRIGRFLGVMETRMSGGAKIDHVAPRERRFVAV
jgi:hypothetical protein